jgi:hypothetical protein
MSFAELIERVDRAVQGQLGSVPVTYASTLGTVEVRGMFDENHHLADPEQVGVEQVGPSVWLRLADLPANPDEDEPLLTIRGTTYRVRRRELDRTGGTVRLLLHVSD